MHSALYYLLAIASLILVAGSVTTVVALFTAPEGYENDEGFVGLTTGDERLLSEYAAFRQQLLAHGGQGQMAA
jgi:hypothetical protein